MGAIEFILYNTKKKEGRPSIDFVNKFMNMKHRGPDDTQYLTITNVDLDKLKKHNPTSYAKVIRTLSRRELSEYTLYIFIHAFHRLAINDLSLDGRQPFEDPIENRIDKYPELSQRPKRRLMCNGEIYNYHTLLNEEEFNDKDLESNSDVEIIMPLYIKYGLEETLNKINGDYSFIITEDLNTWKLSNINIYAVRDRLGNRPLYLIKDKNNPPNLIIFISELKGIPQFILLEKDKYIIKEIPVGHYWSYKNTYIDKNTNEFIKYSSWTNHHNLLNMQITNRDPITTEYLYNSLRTLITNKTIERYTLSNKNVGVLLSGGFDSCLICSIMIKYLISINYNFDDNPFKVFTIGDINNEDRRCAELYVEYIKTKYNIKLEHHIVVIRDYNIMIEKIETVIYDLETYDCTTIRNAIPYYFLFQYITQNTDISVLLTGEGLDDLLGYKQLFQSTDQQMQDLSINLIEHSNKFELLRTDKMASTFGLELRHPYLDYYFVKYILEIHPHLKRPEIPGANMESIEKYLIRKAFSYIETEEYLPKEILWRPLSNITLAFLNLTVYFKNYFDTYYSDSELDHYCNYLLSKGYSHNTCPHTKEDMYYRKTFDKLFPNSTHLLDILFSNLLQ